ncbi:MAG: hypothetical protein QNJ71_07150 [Acidimicrobiia bacterium]|nr:hypothetical protein [Acidimicrobiia bacterium]
MSGRGSQLFAAVRELDLPIGHYAIFGSGPLIIRGIIDAANDVDVVARGAAWERARRLGEVVTLTEHGVDVASFSDGAVTVGTSWAYGDVDIDDLIDTAEIFDDLPFARLEYVVRYKRAAGRPKDLEHLRLLERSGYAPDRAL